MRVFIKGFAALTASVGLLLLAGCGGGLPNADEGVAQQILLRGNGSEPKALDPHLVTGVPENKIISSLIEGLITYHPTDDNLPEPGVAERWEHDGTYTTWTFFLHPDANWSNGDPVTAQDFVYSWNRILNPELGAEYVKMLMVVDGAEDYHYGRAPWEEVGVEAVDEKTLRVTLVGPTPYFLNMLKHYSWFPVHPPTVEAFGGMTDRDGAWATEGNYVGNGPFVLAEWNPNQYIRVTKSDTYWDRETVTLNEIIFFPIEDQNTEQRMFDNGLLHLTNVVPSNNIPALQDANSPFLRIEPYLGTYFYRFNVTRPPLDNPLVRRALTLAIDREAIVEKVTQGGQIPAVGFTPPGFAQFEPEATVHFDPAEAQLLLAQAGYPNGDGFPEKFILFNTLEDHRKIAEAIAAMWNEHLGINVQLENKEWKVYLDAQSELDYEIARAGWIGDYMDPITFLEMWTTGNGNNDTGWASERYDRLIAGAFRSETEEEHFDLLLQAEAELMAALPVAPIYWYTRVYLKDPRVQGWDPKLLDNRPYKYLSLGE